MLVDTVGALRVRYPHDADVLQLTELVLRYERSLRFYANSDNYLEGVAMHEHHGLLAIPDEGQEARYALGNDYPLGAALAA